MPFFTPAAVRTVADAAADLTEGAFAFGNIINSGDGVRFTDGVHMLSWRGPFAAERAAAYYAYAAHDWASREQATGEPALPPVITKALAGLESITGAHDDTTATDEDRDRAARVKEAADDGAHDAEYRWKARTGR